MKKLTILLILLLPVSIAADSGTPWTCSLDNVGATLTLCQKAPTSATNGKRLYITDIIAQSTTATAGQMILKSGTKTSTACDTGTASVLPSAASAVRLAYPANTAAPTVISFTVPLAVSGGKDLCVLAVGTNTISIQIIGVIK